MDKKAKIHLTNEDVLKKFKSSFDLVNYAIRLAENMINTGRDARVKSDVQNRALLILEEIHEGKDQFDEIFASEESDQNRSIDGVYQQSPGHEDRSENRKYRTTEVFETKE